jgi:hypothetical protein
MRKVLIVAFLVAAPAMAQVNPQNPGGTSEPPGTGCEVGTSGCYPSSPPGPVTPPPDPNGVAPSQVTPNAVPFYGSLPGTPEDQSRQPAPSNSQQQQQSQ